MNYNTHLELESLPTGGWGYDHFPFSARYCQGLGVDYLGMTGNSTAHGANLAVLNILMHLGLKWHLPPQTVQNVP